MRAGGGEGCKAENGVRDGRRVESYKDVRAIRRRCGMSGEY